MTARAPGESITPQITIKDSEGQLYDPSSLTLKIYNSAGIIEDTIAKNSMTNPSTGIYYYSYDIPTDADEGDWRYEWESGSQNTIIESVYFTIAIPATTSLATVEDFYREAHITSADVSSVDVAATIVECESILKTLTNRSSFGGAAASLAKKAVVCLAIDSLATALPDKMNITKISENGASIEFGGKKKVAQYQADAERLVKSLRIKSSMGRYNGTNSSTFYRG